MKLRRLAVAAFQEEKKSLLIKERWYVFFVVIPFCITLCSTYAFAKSLDSNIPKVKTKWHQEPPKTSKKLSAKYRFTTIDHPKLDKLGEIRSIVQDSQGFLWFGGGNGIARYDGYDIKLYVNDADDPSSLSNNNIRDMMVDRDGRLWIATKNGLNVFNAERDNFTRYTRDLKVDLGRTVEAVVEGFEPIKIPGRVEAESPSAYRDRSPYNHGGDICGSLAIDAQLTEDIGGGCNVAWTENDEWIEYLIEVSKSGIYDINVRAATSLADKKLHLEVDNLNVSGPINIEQEGWQAFNDHIVPVRLEKGIRRIRLFFDNRGINVNYLDFKEGNGQPIEPLPPTPISSDANVKPGEHALSHYNIWSVWQDKKDYVWVGTRKGVTRLSLTGERDKYFLHNPLDSNTLSADMISTIYEDSDGDIWIGTRNYGLNRYNPQTKSFTRYFRDESDPNSLESQEILVLYEDSFGFLWIGTAEGLNRLNRNSGDITRYVHDYDDPQSLAGKLIKGLVEDREGNLWVTTDGGGLSIFNRSANNFQRIIAGTDSAKGLLNNQITTAFKDKSGDIWFGHFPAGVSRIDPNASVFQNYQHNPLNNATISNSDILSLAEDHKGNLWIGTEKGLNYLDRSTEEITHFFADPNDPDQLQSDAIQSLMQDSRDRLWIGTRQGDLSILKPDTNKFEHYKDDFWKARSSGGRRKPYDGTSIFEDKAGEVWVAINGGLNRTNLDISNITFYSGSIAYFLDWGIHTFNEDSFGNLWIGVEGIYKLKRETESFKHYLQEKNTSASSAKGVSKSVFEDNSGRLWVASQGSGINLFDRTKDEFITYSTSEGLPDNDVTCILQDNEDFLWIGSGQGLIKFDPSTETFKLYSAEHGLPGNVYKAPACLKTSHGELAFGSTEGLTIFDPTKLSSNSYKPPVAITNFQIFNKPVAVDPAAGPLKVDVTQMQELILDYTQTVISFEFAALSFNIPEKNQYAYKLENFDKDWNYVGTKRTATYTNLNAGHYVLHIKGANNDGVWSEYPTSIKITQLPAPWKTWWAYTLYISLIVGAIVYAFYAQQRKRRFVEQQNIILEIKVRERTQELRQKNHDIQEMLTNIKQGLFTIEESGLIHHEYSKYLENIFSSKNISGRNAIEFLFEHAEIGKNRLSEIRESLNAMLGEHVMNYDFNSHKLPHEYDLQNGKDKQHFQLDWNPIVIDNYILKIMVTVRDVTQVREMEREAEQQQKELNIIGQLLYMKGDKYLQLEEGCKQLIRENHEILEQNHKAIPNLIDVFFRNVHTIKGNSRTYSLSYICDAAHEAETIFSELRSDSAKIFDKAKLVKELSKIENCLDEYGRIFRYVLRRENKTNAHSKVDSELDIKALEQVLSCLKMEENGHIEKYKSAQDTLHRLISSPLEEVLKDTINSLPSIASQLGKEPPTVELVVDGLNVKADTEEFFINIFSHILRNSIDHGIESTEERLEKGKPKQGKITLKTAIKGTMLELSIQDDGRGINLNRLFEKGCELGYWEETDEPENSTIAALIFNSGLSTKEKVSDISGRGVGMDAVKNFIESHGGQIKLHLIDEQQSQTGYMPFKFIIHLPNQLFIHTNQNNALGKL